MDKKQQRVVDALKEVIQKIEEDRTSGIKNLEVKVVEHILRSDPNYKETTITFEEYA